MKLISWPFGGSRLPRSPAIALESVSELIPFRKEGETIILRLCDSEAVRRYDLELSEDEARELIARLTRAIDDAPELESAD